MFSTRNQARSHGLFANAALVASLFSFSATAQTLDATVVQNVNETVTYTINLDGPPMGTAYVLFGSMVNPMPVPTPFGPLHIDPLGVFVLGSVQLDMQGRGSVSATTPFAVTAGTSLYFQGLFIDRGILRLSRDYVTTVQDGDPSDFRRPSFAFAHGNGTAHFQAWGSPGDVYTITIIGPNGVVATCRVTVDASCKSQIAKFNLPVRLRRGYRYVVAQDIGAGHVLPRWSGAFRGR